MKRLGVAMVAATSFPANHGSPASIREMSQELARRGHRVHVVTYHWRQNIPVEGVTIHRTPPVGPPDAIAVGPTRERPIYDILLTWELLKVVRREKLDIMHAHNYEGAIAGWIVKQLTGRPLLFNSVTNMEDELPTYQFLQPEELARKIGRGFDKIVPRLANHLTTVTHDLREQYIEEGIPADRVTFVPPGVHPAWFDGADGERIRDELGLGKAPVVIYTGVLNRFQGLEPLIEGFRTIRASLPDARLLLMGNIVTPGQKRYMEELAAAHGVAEAVTHAFDRPLDDLPDFLAAADVAVVPRPSSPGFPVKLLNYMSARRPVVAAAGSAKCVTDGVNGLIVPNRDAEALAQAILRILRDPEMAARMGDHGRRTVESRYEWPVIVDDVEEIYAGLLGLPREERRSVPEAGPEIQARTGS
jgi:glycosyltransferase involved in cell wall biosynthesis